MTTRLLPLGLGFESRVSESTQRGLLEARNADMTAAGVIRKRTGSDTVTTTTTAGGALDMSRVHAVWHRDDEECVVGGDGRLYAFDECQGAWDDRGAWTPARIRQVPIAVDAVSTIDAGGSQTVEDCVVTIWEEVDVGVRNVNYAAVGENGQVIAPRTQISNPGERPKAAAADSFVLLAYVTGTSLIIAPWTPASATAPVWQTVTTALSNGWYDIKGTPGEDDVMVAYAVSATDVVVERYDSAGGIVATTNVTLATAIATDLALHPRTASIFHLAWLAAGNTALTREVGGANVEHSTALGGDTGIKLTVVSAADATEGTDRAIVAVELDPGDVLLRYVEIFRTSVTLGGFQLQRIQLGVYLQGHAETHNGSYLVPLARAGTLAASRAFFVVDLLRDEVLSRAYYGVAESAGSMNLRLSISSADVRNVTGYRFWTATIGGGVGYADIDDGARPQSVAVLDGTAHAAHAGYVRAYDGRYPFEHGWHEVPEIIATVEDAAGSLTPDGTYIYALTWEWYSGNGRLYRSAPTVVTFTLTGGNDRIVLTVKSLHITERSDVKLVSWRSQDTAQGDLTLYREDTQAAPNNVNTLTVNIDAADAAVVGNEPLDQVAGGVLAHDPTPATDFCAVAGGRLFTRDPEREFLVRYSLPRREGFGIGWSPLQGQELPSQGAATALASQDGQFIAFTATGASLWFGDGPDATGAGAFSTPQPLPIEIGCTGQETIAQTPVGIAYGSSAGPRLLTRGRQSQNISEPVERLFLEEGQSVVCMFYQPATGELHVMDDGDLNEQPLRGSLRLHINSGRWAQDDARRQVKDASISPSGSILWLRTLDNGFFRSNRTKYLDGAFAYSVMIGTPWVRSTDSSLQPSAMPLSATIHGHNRDTHTLKMAVYTDYREELVETAAFDVATALASSLHGRYQFRHSFQAPDTRRVGAIRTVMIMEGGTAAASLELIEFELDTRDSRTPIELSELAMPSSVTAGP